MFQKPILGGGSFYNIYVRGIFCDFFTQKCNIYVNTKNVGLVITPYFTQFLDELRIMFNIFIKPVFDFMEDFILSAQIP